MEFGTGFQTTAARLSSAKDVKADRRNHEYKGTPPISRFEALENVTRILPEGRTRRGTPFRDGKSVYMSGIAANVSPVEALMELSRDFVDDPDGRKLFFVYELLHRAEEVGVLRGFSSTVKAVACADYASRASETLFLNTDRLQDVWARRPGKVVMGAYSQLWRHRVKFARIVKKFGGSTRNLTRPMMSKKKNPRPRRRFGTADVRGSRFREVKEVRISTPRRVARSHRRISESVSSGKLVALGLGSFGLTMGAMLMLEKYLIWQAQAKDRLVTA